MSAPASPLPPVAALEAPEAGGWQARPATPHPAGGAPSCDFPPSDEPSTSTVGLAAGLPPPLLSGGCLGISLAMVADALRAPSPRSRRGPASPRSPPASSGFAGVLQRLLGLRWPLGGCAERRSCRASGSVGSGCHPDPWDERSLIERAASWRTQETSCDDEDASSSSRDGPGGGRRRGRRDPAVRFHYPPITSVRLRPRTASGDVPRLFFAPEELDEIEDDRDDTRAADDVETLAVLAPRVAAWTAAPGLSATSSSTDVEIQDSRSGMLLARDGACHVPCEGAASPRQPRAREEGDGGGGNRRYVRGVQIMLREKSTR